MDLSNHSLGSMGSHHMVVLDKDNYHHSYDKPLFFFLIVNYVPTVVVVVVDELDVVLELVVV